MFFSSHGASVKTSRRADSWNSMLPVRSDPSTPLVAFWLRVHPYGEKQLYVLAFPVSIPAISAAQAYISRQDSSLELPVPG